MFQVYSKVTQLCTYVHVSILFQILFHYRILQDTECSSLCYTVGPCLPVFLYSSVYLLIPNF